MKKWILAPVLAAGLATGGCANMSPEDRVAAGGVVGAIVGGAIGSQIGGGVGEQIAAGMIGALIGGYIGASIAEDYNERERQEIQAAQQRALALAATSRKPVMERWQSEDGKKNVTVTTTPAKKTTKAKMVAEKKAAEGGQKGTKKNPVLTQVTEKFEDLPEATACSDETLVSQTQSGTKQQTTRYCDDGSGTKVAVALVDDGG
jgi:surface antigen